MPIPFILAGAAIAVGLYGVKKGFDAKGDFDAAENINEDARKIFDDAKRSLERRKERTQNDLESLGRQKKRLYEDALKPFVEAYQQFKNVDFKDKDFQDEILQVSPDEVLEIREVTIRMEEAVSGTAGALGSGALAGLAAYGSVGVLASASTGTAITGLSGAAATNATLAWFGGGSLAAGGLGMAGGAAVLGGIVAAPVLLVGGLLAASKAEEAKENARSKQLEAQLAAEYMEAAGITALTIGRMATEVRTVLKRLQEDHLDSDLNALQDLVSANIDYRIRWARKLLSRIPPLQNLLPKVNHLRWARKLLSKIPPPQNLLPKVNFRTLNSPQQHLVCRTAILAITAKNLAEARFLEEDGSITKAIRETLRESKNILKKLDEI